MRRGAPLTEGKVPVISPHPADFESADVESLAEGGYDKNYKAKPSPSSGYGLPIPPMMGGGGGGMGMGMGMSIPSGGDISRDSSHSSINSSYGGNNYRVSSNISGWNRIIFSILTKYNPDTIKMITCIVLGVSFLLNCILPLTARIFVCIYTAVGLGVLGTLYLSRSVLQCDDGTEAMRAVSDPIREGAEGFLRVQYSVSCLFIYICEYIFEYMYLYAHNICIFIIPFFVIFFLFYAILFSSFFISFYNLTLVGDC
jgi:hypothetical protein